MVVWKQVFAICRIKKHILFYQLQTKKQSNVGRIRAGSEK